MSIKNKIKITHQPPMKLGSPDDFQTPKEALLPLLPYLKKGWTLWECAEGKGNLVRGLKEFGFNVVGSDIISGTDFFKSDLIKPELDCIVTNPPYSLKNEFLKRCFELKKPFALLLPLTALESENRQRYFRKNGLQLIIPNKTQGTPVVKEDIKPKDSPPILKQDENLDVSFPVELIVGIGIGIAIALVFVFIIRRNPDK